MILGPRLSRLSPYERILSLFTAVRPGEGRCVNYLFLCVFAILFAFYILKPVRDALVLSEFGPVVRAYMYGVAALTLMVLIPIYKLGFDKLRGRAGKHQVLRAVTLFFVSNLVIFYLLGQAGVQLGAIFFVWLAICNVMVAAQFWAFAADLFNIKTGERLFAVIMVGASLGAYAGSQVARALFVTLGAYNLMLLAGVLFLVPVVLSSFAQRCVPDGSRSLIDNDEEGVARRPGNSLQEVISGFSIVFRNRYLLSIGVFMVVMNWVNTTGESILGEFVMDWADKELGTDRPIATSRDAIGSFYGSYYGWITLLQFTIQLFLVSRIFRYLKIKGALLILPMIMLLNYSVLLFLPIFGIIRWTMTAENATMYSVQNTTTQTLYLPVSREEKYVGKTTIDTFFVRFGDFVTSLTVVLAIGLLGLGLKDLIPIGLLLAALLFWLAMRIGKRHEDVIKERAQNQPPTATAPMPKVFVPAGQLYMFSIPPGTFMDPDPGDTLRYQACLEDGSPLPRWIRFDRFNEAFAVRPPENEQGHVRIQLTATDFQGLSCTVVFEMEYGPGPMATVIDS